MRTLPISRFPVGSTVYVPCLGKLATIVLLNECRCRVKVHGPDKLVQFGNREFVASTSHFDNWCLSVPVLAQGESR